MKNLIMTISLLVLISSFSAKDLLQSKNKLTKIGSSSNIKSEGDGEAVTYGMGSNGGYTLKDPSNYRTPQILAHLVPQQRIPSHPGDKVVADETPSDFEFYDGSSKLNKMTISCKIFTNPNDCLSVSNCGWCDSRKCCISGNAFGPLGPCDKASYIFSPPHKPVDPRAKALIAGINPLQFTVVSK